MKEEVFMNPKNNPSSDLVVYIFFQGNR